MKCLIQCPAGGKSWLRCSQMLSLGLTHASRPQGAGGGPLCQHSQALRADFLKPPRFRVWPPRSGGQCLLSSFWKDFDGYGVISRKKSSWGCLRSRHQDKFLHGHPPPPEELKVGGRSRGAGVGNQGTRRRASSSEAPGCRWLLTIGHNIPTRALPDGTRLCNRSQEPAVDPRHCPSLRFT